MSRLCERVASPASRYVDSAAAHPATDLVGVSRSRRYGTGECERLTGIALSGGFREKVTLATKCGDPMPEHTRGAAPYSRQGVLHSVEQSLKLLNTKLIDVLLIHDPYRDELEEAVSPGGLMEGVRELMQAGIVKHCGIAVRENQVCTRRGRNGGRGRVAEGIGARHHGVSGSRCWVSGWV
jgi:predicted oxidoreductase